MSTHNICAPYEDELEVKPAWLDDNGHMNVAYYVHAFDDGGECFFRDLGIGWDYTREGRASIFMMQCDLDFYRELFAGDVLRVTTQLIDWNHKFVHTYQALYHREANYLAASAEMLFIHVSLKDRRSMPLPVAVQDKLNAIMRIHARLARPPQLGRKIAIRHTSE